MTSKKSGTSKSSNMTLEESLNADIETLRTIRDELRVRAHLGQLEAHHLWTDAEVKWGRIEGELKRLRDEVGHPAEDVQRGFKSMVDELGEAYTRIRSALDRA